jgi:hypothetical protein
MDIQRFKSPLRASRAVLPFVMALAAAPALAQRDAGDFPAAAVSFLGQEMPLMEVAVNERDGDYFRDATTRMLDFSDSWGFKSSENPALPAACTEPVSDFLVVGMCRVMTTADACEPGLVARFDSNLQKCRQLAGKR